MWPAACGLIHSPADLLHVHRPCSLHALHLVQGDPLLGHRVAFPDGHGLIARGVEIHRDAERCADFVLPPVATADLSGVVELDVPRLPQLRSQISGRR